jgi:tetratricopeptide (TPR) repeat protein
MRCSVLLAGGIAAFSLIAGPVAISPAVATQVDVCYDGATADERIAACTEAIRVMKPRSERDKSVVASMYFLRGNAYNSRGDYDRAINDFSDAIRLDPNRGGADEAGAVYNNRASVYISKGDYYRALADCNDAVRLNPKYSLAYTTRGVAYQKQGDYDHAIADFSEAVRLDPGRGGSGLIGGGYSNLGNAYRAKGDNGHAIIEWTEAIRLNPQYVGVYYNRGTANIDMGNYDRAISDLTEAIRLDPSKGGSDAIGGAYYNRAFAYRAKGDNERAIADYNEMIRLDPKYENGYLGRGIANLYGGALPNALADLNQATALDPKNARAALWLDIVGQRNGIPSRLSQTMSTIDMTAWPAPVIRLFLGQMTPTSVLAAANDSGATNMKGQLCDANFFIGQWALQRGEKDEATLLFKLASDGCPRNFDTTIAASAELKTLGAIP